MFTCQYEQDQFQFQIERYRKIGFEEENLKAWSYVRTRALIAQCWESEPEFVEVGSEKNSLCRMAAPRGGVSLVLCPIKPDLNLVKSKSEPIQVFVSA